MREIMNYCNHIGRKFFPVELLITPIWEKKKDKQTNAYFL